MIHAILADPVPAASPELLSNGVIAFAVLIYFLDRIVSIVVNVRKSKQEVMPRHELEAKFVRIERDIEVVREERRDVSDKLFERIEQMEKSIGLVLNDFARAVGRLEGNHELANSIKQSVELLAKTAQNHGR